MITYTSEPIPVKPYVKKFLDNGNVIKPYLLDAIYRLFSKHIGLDADVKLNDYALTIKFPLPERVFNRQGYMLTRQNVIVFNALLEGYIKDRFECELEANIRRSIRDEQKFIVEEMIIDLRNKFGLSEEDMPFETIKKSLQRFCNKENIDLQVLKNYAKSVPRRSRLVFNSSTTLTRPQLMRDLGISYSTYWRLKKSGKLHVIKNGRNDLIDVEKSNIPEGYILTS